MRNRKQRWQMCAVLAAGVVLLSATSLADSITSTPNPTAVALSSSGIPTLTDTATLSGGNNPSGTITFVLLGPTSTVVDTETVTISGNGTYSTPTGYTLPFFGTDVGTYEWIASYNGDLNNTPVSSSLGSEQVIVSPAATSLSTNPSPTVAVLTNPINILTDSATLYGGFFPTGTLTFTLFDPFAIPVDTETVTISGDGTYTTPVGYFLAAGPPGNYYWTAMYGGDGNNFPDAGSNEFVTVLTSTPEPSSMMFISAGLLAVLARRALLRRT